MNLVHISLTILIFAPIWKLAYLWMAYQGSDYQKQTGIGFFKMRWNAGLRGEYTIYRRLESLAGKGRSRKERFYNPIKQHQTYLKWLRHFLGDKMPICHSYIAFGDEASFKKLEIQSSDHQIVHYCQLKRRIKQQIKETGQVLTEAQIQQLFDKLYPLSQVETKTKEEHIQNIQEKRLETHSSLFQ